MISKLLRAFRRNRGLSAVFVALIFAGLFGVSLVPALAHHCKGKHAGDPSCEDPGGGGGGEANPEIAYIAQGKNWDVLDLMVMDRDGANQTRIVSGIRFERKPWTPSWSPDGNKIVYANASGPCLGITERDTSGQWSEPGELCPVDGHNLAWHPNSNRIAYVSGVANDPQIDALYFVDILANDEGGYDISEPDVIFEEAFSGVNSPSWSYDGTKIAFAVLKSEGNALSEKIIILDFALLPGDDGYRTELTVPGDAQITILGGLSFGKTNNLLAVSAGDGVGDDDIWCLNPDDPGDVTNLTDAFDQTEGDRRDTSPSWSPDDGAIVFSRNGVAMVMNVNAGAGCPAAATSVTQIAVPRRGSIRKLDWRR